MTPAPAPASHHRLRFPEPQAIVDHILNANRSLPMGEPQSSSIEPNQQKRSSAKKKLSNVAVARKILEAATETRRLTYALSQYRCGFGQPRSPLSPEALADSFNYSFNSTLSGAPHPVSTGNGLSSSSHSRRATSPSRKVSMFLRHLAERDAHEAEEENAKVTSNVEAEWKEYLGLTHAQRVVHDFRKAQKLKKEKEDAEEEERKKAAALAMISKKQQKKQSSNNNSNETEELVEDDEASPSKTAAAGAAAAGLAHSGPAASSLLPTFVSPLPPVPLAGSSSSSSPPPIPSSNELADAERQANAEKFAKDSERRMEHFLKQGVHISHLSEEDLLQRMDHAFDIARRRGEFNASLSRTQAAAQQQQQLHPSNPYYSSSPSRNAGGGSRRGGRLGALSRSLNGGPLAPLDGGGEGGEETNDTTTRPPSSSVLLLQSPTTTIVTQGGGHRSHEGGPLPLARNNSFSWAATATNTTATAAVATTTTAEVSSGHRQNDGRLTPLRSVDPSPPLQPLRTTLSRATSLAHLSNPRPAVCSFASTPGVTANLAAQVRMLQLFFGTFLLTVEWRRSNVFAHVIEQRPSCNTKRAHELDTLPCGVLQEWLERMVQSPSTVASLLLGTPNRLSSHHTQEGPELLGGRGRSEESTIHDWVRLVLLHGPFSSSTAPAPPPPSAPATAPVEPQLEQLLGADALLEEHSRRSFAAVKDAQRSNNPYNNNNNNNNLLPAVKTTAMEVPPPHHHGLLLQPLKKTATTRTKKPVENNDNSRRLVTQARNPTTTTPPHATRSVSPPPPPTDSTGRLWAAFMASSMVQAGHSVLFLSSRRWLVWLPVHSSLILSTREGVKNEDHHNAMAKVSVGDGDGGGSDDSAWNHCRRKSAEAKDRFAFLVQYDDAFVRLGAEHGLLSSAAVERFCRQHLLPTLLRQQDEYQQQRQQQDVKSDHIGVKMHHHHSAEDGGAELTSSESTAPTTTTTTLHGTRSLESSMKQIPSEDEYDRQERLERLEELKAEQQERARLALEREVQELRKAFSKADEDHDGKWSFFEFVKCVTHWVLVVAQERYFAAQCGAKGRGSSHGGPPFAASIPLVGQCLAQLGCPLPPSPVLHDAEGSATSTKRVGKGSNGEDEDEDHQHRHPRHTEIDWQRRQVVALESLVRFLQDDCDAVGLVTTK